MKIGPGFIYQKVKTFSLTLATAFIVSCGGDRPDLYIESVSIYAEPDANNNSATAIDLVIVYDVELMNTLAKMSAAKYFSASRQMLLDNPTMVDVWHWELVPGQIVDNFEPDQEDGAAYGAFVFANYLTEGDHRVKVAPDGVIRIMLLKEDLKNFAIFNATEPRRGKTVTDKPNPWISEDDVEATHFKKKKGPVKKHKPHCNKPTQVPQTQTPGTHCHEPTVCCPPPHAHHPVSKKALAPLPFMKKQHHKHKAR